MGLLFSGLLFLAPDAGASSCGKIRSFESRIDARFAKSGPNLINCGPGAEGASNYALPTDPNAPYEMHVIGVYEGSFPPDPGRSGAPSRESGIQVVVYKTLKPAILVLSAAKPVRWELTLNQNSQVEMVILQGRYEAKISGLPPDIPILRRAWDNACAWSYGWEPEFNRRGGHYKRMVQSLRCATGLRESSFQGCKVGAVFEIPHIKQHQAAADAAFPAPCPLDIEPEIPLGPTSPGRLAVLPAAPRVVEEENPRRKRNPSPAPATRGESPTRYGYAPGVLGDPRVPGMRDEIRAYDDSRRVGDAAEETASLPPNRRRLGKPETLPLPDSNAARSDIPVRALAILLEGDTTLLTHDAIPDLVAALERGDEKLKSRAADALGQLRPPAAAAVRPLMAALKDAGGRVRASAALALGNIGPDAQPAIRLLKRALNDPSADVRYSAQTALERIGTAKALKALGKKRRR